MDNNEPIQYGILKEAGNTFEEGLFNSFGKVYRQQPRPGDSYRNDTVCTEVWHGTEDTANSLGVANTAQAMVTFMEGYKRWGGEGNGYIRKTVYADKDGLKRTDALIGGLKRYWLTYEPGAYNEGQRKNILLS